jgi:hypothetical protein
LAQLDFLLLRIPTLLVVALTLFRPVHPKSSSKFGVAAVAVVLSQLVAVAVAAVAHTSKKLLLLLQAIGGKPLTMPLLQVLLAGLRAMQAPHHRELLALHFR